MDPTLNATTMDENQQPGGTLRLKNTRKAGELRALRAPVMLIGRGEGCDLRLYDEQVEPLHCLIAITGAGPTLRSFGATWVNGHPSEERLLHDGDSLRIGTFEFALSWPTVPPVYPPDLTPLRIQVAAVVAQQAALTEEEWRIQQQQNAFQQQQAQLGEHLDQRHDHLLEMQEQIVQARARWQKERADQEAHLAAAHAQMNEQRREIDRAEQVCRREHERLSSLRKRFLQRWKRHWSAERRNLRNEQSLVAQERARLIQERERIESARLRFNGNMELERQQLREQFQRLEHEQRRIIEQRDGLEQQRHLMEAMRQQWQSDEQLQADRRRALQQEAENIEQRIQNGRLALEAQERRRAELSHTLSNVPTINPVALSPISAPASNAPIELRRYESQLMEHAADLDQRRSQLVELAEQLSDQRSHLVEQFGRMLTVQQDWHQQECEVVLGLEELARQLDAQENEVRLRRQQLQADEQRLNERQADLQRSSAQLEAKWLRYHQHEQQRRADEERTRRDLDSRATRLAAREEALATLLRQWSERRQTEMQQFREEMQRCVEMRERWLQYIQADVERDPLPEDASQLTEQALILEQTRQELLGQGDNPSASAKRLEKLQRRLHAALEQREATVQRHRELLQREREALESRFSELERRANTLMEEETEFQKRIATAQSCQHTAEQCEGERQMLNDLWQRQQASYERQLDDLRNEVERLAMLLIDSAETPSSETRRAA